MNKNMQPQKESDLNKKEHPYTQDKRNYKKKEADSSEKNTKDGDLKLTKKISQNIHTKPAEEQQFETKD
ncbi:MAG: hypothetical protein SGI83_03245 [Bacteroidota bacterium]|nr:hypothetical protein [Bacteroidota bacterium]